MVYAHEIPSGARLYFGATAKLKRTIEHYASQILAEQGFEEIVTPYFSHAEHQQKGARGLISFSGEGNQPLALRADSSLDVARLITKRLGRTTDHTRWFYIQPIFHYPAHELYQIGAEILEEIDLAEVVQSALAIVRHFGIEPVVQFSDPRLTAAIAKAASIDAEVLMEGRLEKLGALSAWMEGMIWQSSPEAIDALVAPEEVMAIVRPLTALAKRCGGRVEALAHASMAYYDGPFFRLICGNQTLAMGGQYRVDTAPAAGFALYVDAMLHLLTNLQEKESHGC